MREREGKCLRTGDLEKMREECNERRNKSKKEEASGACYQYFILFFNRKLQHTNYLIMPNEI